MCGICGAIWTSNGQAVSREQLSQMTAAITHRGPDADGLHQEQTATGGIALGHRRLSIIDIACGQQPMWNEDESVGVIFNGEIYNYRELRETLLSQGHRFHSDSDTEVLVHLYEEHGTAMVHHLRGMFVFAIWDRPRSRVMLARDRFGQKPLVYRQEAGRLLFASEMKAILQLPGVPREVDPESLNHYLTWQYVPAPRSILKGFNKLLPGHLAVWSNDDLSVEQYWSPLSMRDPAPERQVLRDSYRKFTPEQAQQKLKETLSEAVRLRLRSDVPLGAFLSGGIDSTLITGLMQRELDRPVETFSIGFDVPDFDERSYARMAAKHLGTNHHEKVVSPSAVDSLPSLVWQYEEPFADNSAIPTMALCQFTREAVTVALTGDGGDELFMGYDRYRAVQLGERLDALPLPLRMLIKNPLWRKMPASIRQKSFTRRLKRFLTTAALDPRRRYMTWICYFDPQRRNALYSGDFASSLPGATPEDWMDQLYDLTEPIDLVSQTAGVDQISYLPNDILTKVDIASMSVGLECRSPFLDQHVADLACALPVDFKLQGRTGKRILRETFGDLIPEPILQRAKMGFGVPVDHWFREELKPLLYDILLSQRAIDRGYFNEQGIRNLVEQHVSGQFDHSTRLWSLLVLEVWHRIFIDATTVPGRMTETDVRRL
ncbi:asparagine synthase (glutamine-hydrolyzing) [Rubinisphaera margarita]|uniref:asparagine synthase (glutamine-hydrolyzing) n=1 Tax=Rubinisphaera margarita TaxID=2909586 RepID=UPI001EE7E798|nr:asparagine synthase (glutamine-hydrolyzing) [Rubinisphaera margarita]MCG6154724.1 asparagine synthase (glutamine-hydrolyzing) [Rubinisphaera margarita]